MAIDKVKENNPFTEIANETFTLANTDEQRGTETTNKLKGKPRRTRSDKGIKRKNDKEIVKEVISATKGEVNTVKMMVKQITDYIASKPNCEHWKATNDEIDVLSSSIANVLKKYIPAMEKYKEEFDFGMAVVGFVSIRLMMKGNVND